MESLVSSLLSFLLIYLLVGIFFSILFLRKGITVVDEDASGTSLYFKLIISPGVVIFWPYLLRKWMIKIKRK